MRFLLTEKKGCSFHKFLNETKRIHKLKILFIDYNNILFKFVEKSSNGSFDTQTDWGFKIKTPEKE
jgi:hypothetical protein